MAILVTNEPSHYLWDRLGLVDCDGVTIPITNPVVLILLVKLAFMMAPLGTPLTILNHPAPSLTADIILLGTFLAT